MGNIIDYAKSEFRTFKELPFSEVDSLILSWLSYLYLPESITNLKTERGIGIRDLFCAEYFSEMTTGVKFPESTMELLTAATASPRFRKLGIFKYDQFLDPDKDVQFAAVTFELEDNLFYVAFRGTDDSFTGWKEDFDMALEGPVLSQKLATQYLEDIYDLTEGQLIIGGHSKGGNLAVYSAATCDDEIKSHIKCIYTHDGPGFLASELEHPGFAQIRDRIIKTLPQSSMIGMTFEQECDFQIIRSNEKGIMQHNPFSWVIENSEFVMMKSLTKESELVYKSLNEWVAGLNEEEREVFINVIFDILGETGADSFNDLGANLQRDIPIIAKSIRNLNPATRKFMLRTIGNLALTGAKNVPEVLWNQNFPDFSFEKLTLKNKHKEYS